MTQNQKFMKLGTGKGMPSAQTMRRMRVRGGAWLTRFRVEHEAKTQRSAARTHQRNLEEIKRLKAEQKRDRE